MQVYCRLPDKRNRLRFFRSTTIAIGCVAIGWPSVAILLHCTAFAQPPNVADKPTAGSLATPEGQEAPQEESIKGKVSKVIDGDSLKVKDSVGKEFEVQIEGTDAPEAKQQYGKESTDALRKLVADRDVRLTWTKKDNFDRLLAQVFVGEEHINAKMIQEGHAWHFKRYNKSETLAALEDEARKEKRGLWGVENPQAPWDYRKENRAPDKPDR